MAKLQVKGLVKKFGNMLAVDDVTLEFPDGKLTVMVGPSGCGKTTLLRILAGLEEPTAGEVIVADRVVTLVPAWDRNIAMVFQSYALYPHMTVFKNMAFPLEARRVPMPEIKKRVEQTAAILEIDKLLHRYPRQLSGGQMQRVAIGRAIVRKPEVFLMDEPLSNLDAQLRVNMRAQLKRLQMDLGVTTIYVTHDQAEAMTMADQIVVMKNGVVQQVSGPEEVYNNPQNIFVAGFMGSPPMNFISGRLTGDGPHFQSPRFTLELPPEVKPRLTGVSRDQDLVLGVRPEDITLAKGPTVCSIEGTVYIGEVLGKETLVTVKCGDDHLKVTVPTSLHLRIGDAVWLRPAAEGLRIFDAASGKLLFNASLPAQPTTSPALAA